MESSDVTLVVGDQELACHKAILMSRSIYFRSLLSASGGFRESGKERYEIEEPFDLFQKMIQFIYEGTIRDEDLTPVCLDLIPMADEYLVEDLKAACELLACSEDVVTSSNVLDALLVAHRSNCDTLFRFCVPIFTASKSALMGSEKWQELKQLDFVERLLAADPSFSIPNVSWLQSDIENETLSKLANDMDHLLEVGDKCKKKRCLRMVNPKKGTKRSNWDMVACSDYKAVLSPPSKSWCPSMPR